MRVAEAEFAFRLKGSLPARERVYGVQEVLDAVESLHPAIEIPDSRYDDYASVGAPQLIADTACACWLLVGEATEADWRREDLAAHAVDTLLNGQPSGSGVGANVLRDPRLALTWLANELRTYGQGLTAGDLVTTGTCITPVPRRARGHVPCGFREVWFGADGAGVGSAFLSAFINACGAPPPRSRAATSRRARAAGAAVSCLLTPKPTFSNNLPIVFRPSRSLWALAASHSGYVPEIRTLTAPDAT